MNVVTIVWETFVIAVAIFVITVMNNVAVGELIVAILILVLQ